MRATRMLTTASLAVVAVAALVMAVAVYRLSTRPAPPASVVPGPAVGRSAAATALAGVEHGTESVAAWRKRVARGYRDSLARLSAREVATAAESPEALPMSGAASAPLVIAEFTDMQCPACALYETSVKSVVDTYVQRGLVRVIHYDLPLPIHAHSLEGAMFAHCAADEDAYGAARDALMANQGVWGESPAPRAAFATMAVALHLDTARVMRCYDLGSHAAVVAFGLREARRRGIPGTPSLMMAGHLLTGVPSGMVLQDAIEAALYGTGAAPEAAPSWKATLARDAAAPVSRP